MVIELTEAELVLQEKLAATWASILNCTVDGEIDFFKAGARRVTVSSILHCGFDSRSLTFISNNLPHCV